MIRTFSRRAGAVLAAAAVTALGLTGTVPAAAAATTLDPATSASYLVHRLVGGDHYEPFGPGLTDTGLTIDGIFALAAVGGQDAVLAKMTANVAQDAPTYAGLADTKQDPFSAGAAGKIALAAEVTGQDPKDFGGHDYITGLLDHLCTDARAAGCERTGLFQGAGSLFSQALPVLALARAGSRVPLSAVTALTDLACPGGGFGSDVAGCQADADADADSTAMAAMALAKVDDQQPIVAKAVAWLADQQVSATTSAAGAGSWSSATTYSTNSTGLAVQALGLAGSTYAANIAAGRTFLASVRNADGGLRRSADRANGADSDVRATSQGLGGYQGISFGTLSRPISLAKPPTPATTTGHRGAAYLAGQLTEQGHLPKKDGYYDYGLDADIAIALAADGGYDRQLGVLVRYLARNVATYADTAKAQGGPYAGSLAKLGLVAEITGQDPRAFGGVDLLDAVHKTVCGKPSGGQYPACTAAGDLYNAGSSVSQALGVLALQRADVGLSVRSPVVVRLLQLQCDDGGFSSTLITGSDKCDSDVDTTGFALQALSLVPGAVDQSRHATQWLLARQDASGALPGAAGLNTNSTALGIEGALATAPAAAPPAAAAPTASAFVAAAQRYLGRAQHTDGGFGIDVAAATSDARSSAQSVPALLLSSLATARHPVRLFPSGGGTSAPTPTPTGSASRPAPSSAQPPSNPPSASPPASPPAASLPAASPALPPAASLPASPPAPSLGAPERSGELAATGLDSNRVGEHLVVGFGLLILGGAGILLARRRPGQHR